MPHPLPAGLRGLELPRQTIWDSKQVIPAPKEDVFTSSFGHAYPAPHLLDSGLGTTAVYDIQPPSGHAKRNVLVIHGVCTPAIGQLPLIQQIQALDPDTHFVVFDLWGHGRSTTPLVPHTASMSFRCCKSFLICSGPRLIWWGTRLGARLLCALRRTILGLYQQ